MKKIIIFIAAIVLMLALGGLIACDSGGDSSSTPSVPSEPSSDQPGDPAEDTHKHKAAAVWSSDGTYHWHACTVKGCTEKLDKEEHSPIDDIYFKDDKSHWLSCICGEDISAAEHTYTEPVIGTDAHWTRCICGAKSESIPHNFAETPVIGDTTHWQECECGAKKGEAAHTISRWQYTEGHDAAFCSCGKPMAEFDTVRSERVEIDLNMTTSGPNTAQDITLDLGTKGYGTVQSVSLDAEPIGTSLTLKASAFSYAYGEHMVTVVTKTSDGASHTFYVPVMLVSKVIKTKADLNNLAGMAKQYGDTDKWGGYFVLGANISYNGDFAGVGSTSSPAIDYGFTGVFDGRGYAIDGLRMTGTYDYTGFIAVLCGGEIRNVSFTNANLDYRSGYVCARGYGLVENVSVQYQAVTLRSGYHGGTFYGRFAEKGARVSHCVVDFSKADLSASAGEFYTIGSGINSLGKQVQGIVRSVYIIGAPAGSLILRGGVNTDAVYGIYADSAALASDKFARQDIALWDPTFWKVTGGVPYPKYASSLSAVEVDENFRLEGGVPVSGKTARITLSSIQTEFGTFRSATFNGKSLDASFSGGALSFDTKAFGTAYGEHEITVTFFDGTAERTFDINLLLITMRIESAQDLKDMVVISKACESSEVLWGGYFVFDRDVSWNSAEVYESIAYGVTDAVRDSGGFCGVIDGRGYVVDGLYTGDGTMNCKGFVSVLRGGIIKNLGFTHAHLKTKGGLVCSAGQGTVENVYVSYSEFAALSATDPNKLGTFFGNKPDAGAKVINCVVDFRNVQTLLDNGKAFTVGIVNADTVENVYVLGAPQGFKSVDNSTLTENIYHAFDDSEAFRSAYWEKGSQLKAVIDTWDDTVWSVDDGVVTFTSAPPIDESIFVQKGGRTEYGLIVGVDDGTLTATAFLQKHILAATGATLRTVTSVGWTQSSKRIVVGDWELFAAAGLKMSQDATYCVITKGNTVFAMAKNEADYQLVILELLRQLVGYEMFGGDLVVYEKVDNEKDGVELPSIAFEGAPAFENRINGPLMDSDEKYGMGFSAQNELHGPNGSLWHNSFIYLPYETYSAAHPDWYTGNLDTTGKTVQRQLCYNAHGNPTELAAMKETLFEKLWELVQANPTWKAVTITQEDNHYSCNCSVCAKELVPVAPVIRFVNAIDEMLRARFEKEGIDRTVKLYLFAYRDYKEAPTDGTKCNENVGVVVAPIEAIFAKGLTDPANAYFKENIGQWSKITSEIYLWLYEVNYSFNLYPYSTWDSVADWMQTSSEFGSVKYIYNQSFYYTKAVTAFTRLKVYLDSRLEVDPTLDTDTLIDKFFRYYYGPAGSIMRTMYEEMKQHMATLAEKYPTVADGSYRENLRGTTYWPKATVDRWLDYIDQAYAKLDTSDENYEVYKEHILVESFSPRFIKAAWHISRTKGLFGYTGSLSATDKAFVQQLIADLAERKITNVAEGAPLTDYYDQWGL